MSGLDATFGVKDELVYGEAVTVDRFYEQVKNSLKGKPERIESKAVRAGSRFLRADRWAVNPKGASGTVALEVLGQGFGWWLGKCLGDITTVAGADTEAGSYEHTATPASLAGQSFTSQVGKPDSADLVHPFTYPGCKVTGWELSADVDGIVSLSVDIDAAREYAAGAGPFALQPADYTPLDGAELLTYVGGHISIDGEQVYVSQVTFKGDNALNADRWKQGAVKREQVADDLAGVTFELDMDFDDMAQVNRINSATAAGAIGEIVTYWQAPTEIGATGLFPTLKVTVAAGRFDGELPEIDGAKMIAEKVTGKALDDGTHPVIAIGYTTSDPTP